MRELSEDFVAVLRAEAFRSILTIDFWYRRKFNLAPTDERYLNATPEEMLLEFYRYQLYERYQEAKSEGREVNSVEDLLLEEDFDKRLAELDRQLEAEALVVEPVAEPVPEEEDYGSLISVKAPEDWTK